MTESAVQVSGLHKKYSAKVAVANVSFDVGAGEIFGILGPNGAGKTTTVESISGLRVGDGGSIRVHGINPWTDRAATTRTVGVQLQESALQPKITVGEALRLWSAFYKDPEPWEDLAEILGLLDHRNQRFENLSGGQQQRLSIALALVGRPRVAILDELTTGLDPRARRRIWQLIREMRDAGTTVLLVTHSMEEAQQLCDRLAIIDAGKVRALGTPQELIGSAAAATVISFAPSAPIDVESLRNLDGVSSARTENGRVVVEGAEDTAAAVLTHLRQQEVSAHRLRVEEGSLDTAYLDLTLNTPQEETL